MSSYRFNLNSFKCTLKIITSLYMHPHDILIIKSKCPLVCFIMISFNILHVNYWLNTPPCTFPLCSQYQKLIVPFFFHFDIELSYGDNCSLFSLALLRPVSSRPWNIFQFIFKLTKVFSQIIREGGTLLCLLCLCSEV